jgi:hypothetical protein
MIVVVEAQRRSDALRRVTMRSISLPFNWWIQRRLLSPAWFETNYLTHIGDGDKGKRASHGPAYMQSPHRQGMRSRTCSAPE